MAAIPARVKSNPNPLPLFYQVRVFYRTRLISLKLPTCNILKINRRVNVGRRKLPILRENLGSPLAQNWDKELAFHRGHPYSRLNRQ